MEYDALNTLLTENEKKVYIELLKLGESTASPILEKTGIQNSVFYRTIHRLMEKGFVTYVLKRKIKHFRTTDPQIFLTQMKKKEQEVHDIIPVLKKIQKLPNSKTTAEVFVGMKGVLSMYCQLIQNATKKEEYYFFGPKQEIAKEAMEKVYIPFRKYRNEKKIIVYGINPLNIKKQIEQPSSVKEKFTNFPLPANMAIFQDKIAIVSWKETPTGILIQSKDVAEQYKELFKEIWKASK